MGGKADPRALELIGTAIGERYRVDAIIGSGGMGTVVRAHDLRLKRDVAVKIMSGNAAAASELEERFEREAESVARLEHPNIVAILDIGSTPEGMKYQVMQLLEGYELEEVLTGPFEPARAVSLITQILRGLEHAHRHGVVHRDLKPQNVFLSRDEAGEEVVRILDFGLAKLVAPGAERPPAVPQLTLAGFAIGTPRYMSPEQALGSAVDHRTDIYSAGVLLYEMLAGKPPFSGPNVVETIRQHLVDDPPPLPERVPAELREIAAKMLAKSAAERYASATEVLAAFAPRRARPPVVPTRTREQLAPVPHVAEPTRKSPRTRRHAPLVRAPLLVAALLCALIVAWLVAPGATVQERIDMLSDRVAQLVSRVTRSQAE